MIQVKVGMHPAPSAEQPKREEAPAQEPKPDPKPAPKK